MTGSLILASIAKIAWRERENQRTWKINKIVLHEQGERDGENLQWKQ
jgi:hypothetical protein